MDSNPAQAIISFVEAMEDFPNLSALDLSPYAIERFLQGLEDRRIIIPAGTRWRAHFSIERLRSMAEVKEMISKCLDVAVEGLMSQEEEDLDRSSDIITRHLMPNVGALDRRRLRSIVLEALAKEIKLLQKIPKDQSQTTPRIDMVLRAGVKLHVIDGGDLDPLIRSNGPFDPKGLFLIHKKGTLMKMTTKEGYQNWEQEEDSTKPTQQFYPRQFHFRHEGRWPHSREKGVTKARMMRVGA